MPASTSDILPDDGTSGTLIGRVWRRGHSHGHKGGMPDGPSVVVVRADGLYDITAAAPTVADLCNAPDPVALVRHADGDRLGALKDHIGDLLAPIDLQAIKAAGVTFAVSLLERLIEEHAKGDPGRAEQVRKELNQIIGADVSTIKPGSPEAEALEEDADGARRLVALSRGRHRPLCRDLHQGAGHGGGGLRRGDRHPLGLGLEQSRTGGDAGRQRARPHRGRHPGQRRQSARHRRPQRPAAGPGQGQQRLLRHRPLHPAVRLRPSRSTTCARPRSSSR